jgi:hypothetical protein
MLPALHHNRPFLGRYCELGNPEQERQRYLPMLVWTDKLLKKTNSITGSYRIPLAIQFAWAIILVNFPSLQLQSESIHN